jgi:hypothetical protein
MRRIKHLSLVLLALVLLVSVPLVQAAYFDSPPAVPGWTHPPYNGDDPGVGVQLSGAPVIRSSPTIADIDGNPGNGQEVAVGGSDGLLYVYRSNGTKLWSLNVMPAACNIAAGDYVLNTAPAVGKLLGTATPYVVVTYGTILLQSNCDGGVAVYNGATGALQWRFSLRAWQVSQGYPNEALDGAVSSPALADTDGDGQMEIGFGGLDRNLYLLNADGSVRWYYHAADSIWSSPAFANVDGDAALELVTGTDISANPQVIPPTTDGGFVYAFDTQPRAPKRIEFNTGYIWRTPNLGQAIFSSPAIGDVLASNPGSEIVIGSSCFFPTAVPDRQPGNKTGKWIKVLRLSDGATLQTLPTDACVQSSAALGDIDDDGTLEIVATVNSPSIDDNCPSAVNQSKIVAWHAASTTPIWSTVPRDANSGCNDGFGGDLQSPVIADLDGNGSLEVLAANWWSVAVLNGKTGAALTCQKTPNCGSRKSLFAAYTVKSTPAVGDINGDGKLDVVIGGAHIWLNSGKTGMLYAWTNFASAGLGSPAGSQPNYSAPWPMFRGNPAHTGVLSVPALRSSATGISQIVEQGASARTVHISITDATNGALDWTATDNQSWISLGDTSGTTPATLDVTINPSALALGTHTGKVTLNSSFGDPEINVTVRVVDEVFTVYLPMSRR